MKGGRLPLPFVPASYPLKGGGLLRPLANTEIRPLSVACAALDPYLTLGVGADVIAHYLTLFESGVFRFTLEANGAMAGILILRWPWLRGPFIDMLTVLPAYQGTGLGHAAVSWAAERAARLSSNLWATVSDFNTPARAFWKAQGFVETADLADLVTGGFSEILLRRRLD